MKDNDNNLSFRQLLFGCKRETISPSQVTAQLIFHWISVSAVLFLCVLLTTDLSEHFLYATAIFSIPFSLPSAYLNIKNHYHSASRGGISTVVLFGSTSAGCAILWMIDTKI